MHVLFVHNNFPAQFKFIAPRLAGDYGWRCTFVRQKHLLTPFQEPHDMVREAAGGMTDATGHAWYTTARCQSAKNTF